MADTLWPIHKRKHESWFPSLLHFQVLALSLSLPFFSLWPFSFRSPFVVTLFSVLLNPIFFCSPTIYHRFRRLSVILLKILIAFLSPTWSFLILLFPSPSTITQQWYFLQVSHFPIFIFPTQSSQSPLSLPFYLFSLFYCLLSLHHITLSSLSSHSS